MRLIDADAFARTLHEISKRQGYDTLFSDNKLSVDDVINAIICELDGTGLEEFRNAPTVEAIPKEKVDQAIERIKKVANSGQFNEAVCFGLTHAMFIFKMCTMEEDGE